MGFVHSDAFKYVIGAIVGGIGTLIAWVLQETSHYTADRRERRRAISLALTDLWEIEYHFRALNLVLERLGHSLTFQRKLKRRSGLSSSKCFFRIRPSFTSGTTRASQLSPPLSRAWIRLAPRI